MKRKEILAGVLAVMLGVGIIGCGQSAETQHKNETTAQADAETTKEEAAGSQTEGEAVSEILPAYEYPGPELFYSVVYRYVVDTFGNNYDATDVCIPSVSEIYLDESDRSDIKLYGDFWIFNYNLDGDTLVTQSGGDYPGVMHLKTLDDSPEGYEVTSFDLVADGSDFDKTAKEYFGEHYDAFMKIYSDQDAKEEVRAQIISNYVAANELSITQYQDSGWDPVKLPAENIDSFYSQLD